jgi:hypothetical protein
MIREIWRKYNVSTIMILPIFWRISKNINSKKEDIHFPFLQLAFEYGLINTFLYKNKKDNNTLYLLFDKQQFITDKQLTKSPYYSMCELLLDCEYYDSLEMYNDYVLFGLKIPEEYLDDIEKITEGKYSLVSEKYKEELHFKTKTSHIPYTDNKTAIYIIKYDLPFAVTVKGIRLKDELDEVMKIDLSTDMEFYSKFNPEKENFTPKALNA